MALEDKINKLNKAFTDAARELSATYPAVWEKLDSLCGDDARAKAAYMVYGHPPGFGGKTALEVVEAYGEDAMLNYIGAVEAGVYV